jgi:hypothetical protein
MILIVFIIIKINNADTQRITKPTTTCTIRQKSSCSTFIAFNFNILNDINEACQLYWVNFSGNLVFYKNIASRTTIGMNSWQRHYWILTSASGKIHQFTTGVAPFSTSGSTIKISQIPYL